MTTVDDKPLILFDGVCNLCESSVRFVIKRDSKRTFMFASIQSSAGQRRLEALGYEHDQLSSVLLIADNRLYRKSRAALQIAKRMDGAWPMFYYLFFWVPAFLADPIYSFIGDRRYKWYGMKDECWVPTDDLRQRFLDDG